MKLESFEFWDENDAGYRWPVTNGNQGYQISASNGRNGAGMFLRSGGVVITPKNRYLLHEETPGAVGSAQTMLQDHFYDAGAAAWSIGIAIKFSDIEHIERMPLVALLDMNPDNAVDYLGRYYATQCAVHFCEDQKLRLVRGEWNNYTHLHTIPYVLKRGVWHYLEFKFSIALAGGAFVCRIDGQEVANVGSLTTQVSTLPASANGIRFFHHKFTEGANRNARAYYIDDIYINSGDFFTDVDVECIRPNVDGFYSDWTPSAGTMNYAMVDDITPDESFTYNSAAAVSNTDTYEYVNLTHSSGTVHGLTINMGMFNDGYNLPTQQGGVAAVIRTGGSDYIAGQSGTVGTIVYHVQSEGYTQNPDTLARFAISDVNSAQFGIRRTS